MREVAAVAIALVAVGLMAGLTGWELGRRKEKAYALWRWARILTILKRIEPEAFEAMEIVVEMLDQEDQEVTELERLGRK